MGVDALAKRFFPLILCLLLGAAAYFQAVGLGQILAASGLITPEVRAAQPAPGRASAAPAGPRDHATRADAILERNPFDSLTGPLTGERLDLTAASKEAAPLNEDPYKDPPCEGARVLLIAAAEDPTWSFASIAGPDGKSALRREGDELNGFKVAFIGDPRTEERRKADAPGLWDRVWLTNGGARCQMQVGVAPPPAPPPQPTVSREPGSSLSEVARRIRKVGPGEFEVERGVVERILENPQELMKARIVPDKQGDRFVGVKIFGIRPDSVLGALGLQNGDSLSTINGFDMASPEAALAAYTKLRGADHLSVALTRQGKPMNIDIKIR